MKENRLRQMIDAGQVPVGTVVFEFATPGIGRLANEAGADFMMLDMEHTGWTFETIKLVIAATRSVPIAVMVRTMARRSQPGTYSRIIKRSPWCSTASMTGMTPLWVSWLESGTRAASRAAFVRLPLPRAGSRGSVGREIPRFRRDSRGSRRRVPDACSTSAPCRAPRGSGSRRGTA